MLTKQHAKEIARKLEAIIGTSKAHTIASIYVEGILVASFGIRHGSRRDQGHDHIPKDIHFSPNKTRKLAECKITREEWIKELQERGLI